MRKTFMRKTALKILSALALCLGAQAASADDWTWYVGASIGRTKTGDAGCIFPDMPCDRSSNNGGVQAGVEFDKNWAVEVGYKDLGRIVDQNDMTTGNSILVKSRLGEMSVLGMFPIGRFVPYLRGGAYYAHNAMESNMIAAATGDQANWTVGAGLRFDVTKWLAVRAEWQRYNNVGHANVGVRTDVETSTLGVLLRF